MYIQQIKKGHVYVLQTPLFRVRNRRTKIKNKEVIAEADARRVKGEKKNDFITRYCYSEEERVAAISELGPDPEITRFKGLGEISPDEFAHFIGPDMRLEQVDAIADRESGLALCVATARILTVMHVAKR